MTTLTPGQLAQQHNRTADGRYAEGIHADPGNLDLVVPICPRCDGEWGGDPTCARCTDSDGDPLPYDQPGPLGTEDEKELAKQWGTVDVAVGSRTPWGKADIVHPTVPGVVAVATPGHGGVKLSPERNRAIPAALRNSSGWYEEDCEASIVAMVHPDAFTENGADEMRVAAEARAEVIDLFPDAYEKATGETVEFGQSSVRDRATWETQNAGKPCIRTTGATEHPDYPGMVVVTTGVTGDATDRGRHMMPLADYQAAEAARRFGAATVDPLLPASAVRVAEVARAAKPARPAVTTLAPVAHERTSKAQMELDKLWRDRDGRVFTLREDIEAGKFCGKNAYYNDGRWSYSLNFTGDESRAMPVSKAVFDAYTGPDSRSDSQKAWQQVAVKLDALERAQAADFNPRTYDTHRAKLAKARDELAKARAEAERLSAERTAVLAPKLEAERAAAAAADKAAIDAAYTQLKGRG